MKHWIMPIIADFDSLDTQEGRSVYIVWRTHTRFSVGDMAYFYIKHPEMRVAYKLQVSRINVPSNDFLSGKKSYINREYYLHDDGRPSSFVEFLLLEKYPVAKSYSHNALLGQDRGISTSIILSPFRR